MPDRLDSVVELLIGDAQMVRVTGRPEPVPMELRRAWRVAALVLLLAGSRSKRASREKVLLLSYALTNPATQDGLIDVLSGKVSPFFLQVRVDPALGRAVDFAIGLGLMERAGKSLQLTESGIRLADAVSSDESVLIQEKAFLQRVRRLATEGRVREVLRWR